MYVYTPSTYCTHYSIHVGHVPSMLDPPYQHLRSSGRADQVDASGQPVADQLLDAAGMTGSQSTCHGHLGEGPLESMEPILAGPLCPHIYSHSFLVGR
jgi:hypothetical protein